MSHRSDSHPGLRPPGPAAAAAACLGLAAVLASCGTTVEFRSPEVPASRAAVVALAADRFDAAAAAWRDIDNGANHSPDAVSDKGPAAAPLPGALDRYNAAVADLLPLLDALAPVGEWDDALEFEAGGRTVRVAFDGSMDGIPEWSPGHFELLVRASDVAMERPRPPAAGPGIGVPCTLALDRPTSLLERLGFIPKTGIHVPATAVLEFGPDPADEATLRLHNPAYIASARAGRRERPIAYDYTAAVQLSLGSERVKQLAFAGLLQPEAKLGELGLFFLNVYDPDKIPVVFVHGLDSAPHIWVDAINAILADPELRERFQPAFFVYPSGLPVTSSAARFRAKFEEARARLDPEGDDPAWRNVVLVGHSMGGLVARMQVIDSADAFVKAFFRVPIDDLTFISEAQRSGLREALEFEAVPGIRRVVFIATPHRGSEIADIWAIRVLFRFLIKIPTATLTLATSILTFDTDSLNPVLLEFDALGQRSVDNLNPRHPFFEALAQPPIEVPFHSIVGDRGKPGARDPSDGVVPYRSSHLEGAESELTVPYGHSCTQKPETVAEILRILRLHLRQPPSR